MSQSTTAAVRQNEMNVNITLLTTIAQREQPVSRACESDDGDMETTWDARIASARW